MRLWISAFFAATPALVLAQEMPMEVNGHHLEIIEFAAPLKELLVDGDVAVFDQYWIAPRSGPFELGGDTVMIFDTHPGGNACEGPMPLILVLNSGEEGLVAGPLDTCAPVEIVVEADHLRFVPADGGPEQVWAPGTGFVSG